MIQANSQQPKSPRIVGLSNRAANAAIRAGYNLPADAARMYCAIITHKVRACRGVSKKTVCELFDYAVSVG